VLDRGCRRSRRRRDRRIQQVIVDTGALGDSIARGRLADIAVRF
jgi:hypothetical protein